MQVMMQKHIDDMRSFNRFYTGVIGLLDKHILNSNYTLPELRVLYELYHNEGSTAKDIIDLLVLDKGYLSRILKRFERDKIITKVQSKSDRRAVYIFLTETGKTEFKKLNRDSDQQIAAILSLLKTKEINSLIKHMKSIKSILQSAKI